MAEDVYFLRLIRFILFILQSIIIRVIGWFL